MNLLDDVQTRAYDRALNLCPDDFHWENMPGQKVLLKVISKRDNRWHGYLMTDDTCSCDSYGWCYHRSLLHLNGGVSGIKIRLYFDSP